MRLWHYKLIPVLPKKMLISQWRECIAIKRQWEKGTLKHRLVNYVKDYDKSYFETYIIQLVLEMSNRHINFQNKYYIELMQFCDNEKYNIESYPEHNDRYYEQCFYNLQEKFDRGIITLDEYLLIRNQRIEFHEKKGE